MNPNITELEKKELQLLIEELERIQDWGSIEQWKNRNFIFLSDAIFDKTKMRISLSTLKRICGKIDSIYLPNVSTLDVIAQYLDFKDWASFIQHKKRENTLIVTKIKETTNHGNAKFRIKKPVFFYSTGGLLILFTSLYFLMKEQKPKASSVLANFEFTCINPIGTTPHNIVFHYDLKNVNDAHPLVLRYIGMGTLFDSFAIAGRTMKSPIFNYKSEIPGVYTMQLSYNQNVLKEFNITTESPGFCLLIDSPRNGRYSIILPEKDIVKNGVLGLSSKDIEAMGHPPLQTNPSYLLVKDSINKQCTDGVDISLKIKNDSYAGNDICNRCYITVLGKNHYFAFGIANKGCGSTIKIYYPPNNEFISGQTTDLTNLEINLKEWTDIRISHKSNDFKVFINSNLAFEKSVNERMDFAGLKIKFHGYGLIDDVSISDTRGKLIYTNNFDSK